MEQPSIFLSGRRSSPCNYCESGTERTTFDIYGDNVSGPQHRQLIHRGFRRCGSLFYRPEWDECCRLVPIRCFCSRKWSREEVKVLKRLRHHLVSDHAQKESDAPSPDGEIRQTSDHASSSYTQDSAYRVAREALSVAVEEFLQQTPALSAALLPIDRARFKVDSIQLQPSKKFKSSLPGVYIFNAVV
jgi:arginyl-tRNA--protein-N-Asp/Glu arginylyltransferase